MRIMYDVVAVHLKVNRTRVVLQVNVSEYILLACDRMSDEI